MKSTAARMVILLFALMVSMIPACLALDYHSKPGDPASGAILLFLTFWAPLGLPVLALGCVLRRRRGVDHPFDVERVFE